MSRAAQLHELFKDADEGKRIIIEKLIDEAVFLEEQLISLKRFPFIKSKEIDGVVLTKVTAAGKQYREYLQTYTNIIDKLCRIHGNENSEEASPLRDFWSSARELLKEANSK